MHSQEISKVRQMCYKLEQIKKNGNINLLMKFIICSCDKFSKIFANTGNVVIGL